METARQASRAETPRREGEEALRAVGDLDVDSDSENEDDDAAGFTGRASDFRRERGGEGDVPRARARSASTPPSMGMAYAWMRRDQRRYANAVKFWDTAASSIQAAFEETLAQNRPVPRYARADTFRRRACSARFAPRRVPPGGVRGAQERRAGGGRDGRAHHLRRLGFGRALASSVPGAPREARGGGKTAGLLIVIDGGARPVPRMARLLFRAGDAGLAHHRGDAAAVRERPRHSVDLLEDLPAPTARIIYTSGTPRRDATKV